MTVALEWIITVHSFSVELYGHDSGIILYMINGSRAHLLIQFSLFSLYSNQYTVYASVLIRTCVDSSLASRSQSPSLPA